MVVLDVIQEEFDFVLFIVRDLIFLKNIEAFLQSIDVFLKRECGFMVILVVQSLEVRLGCLFSLLSLRIAIVISSECLYCNTTTGDALHPVLGISSTSCQRT
jgi:hypothetical protein